jgi:hypothetical protein
VATLVLILVSFVGEKLQGIAEMTGLGTGFFGTAVVAIITHCRNDQHNPAVGSALTIWPWVTCWRNMFNMFAWVFPYLRFAGVPGSIDSNLYWQAG